MSERVTADVLNLNTMLILMSVVLGLVVNMFFLSRELRDIYYTKLENAMEDSYGEHALEKINDSDVKLPVPVIYVALTKEEGAVKGINGALLDKTGNVQTISSIDDLKNFFWKKAKLRFVYAPDKYGKYITISE